MSTAASDRRRAAENALWHALEERRDKLRAAGQKFNARQYGKMAEAHSAGKVIEWMNANMESESGKGDIYYLDPMARAIKAGLETWEHVLIRPGQPWTPYVTAAARRAAQGFIEDAQAYIPFL